MAHLRDKSVLTFTELLDLQSLAVTALRNRCYEALYKFKHFNSIQTRVFPVLYHSDDNVMIAAPTGSGKTVCAELAILRNHKKGPDSVMRAVYIAPLEAIAKVRYHDWNRRLGQGLDIEVVDFSGETPRDWEPPEKGYIIISTPEKWDARSRWWKRWKYVAQVTLFLIDDIHMIGGKDGHVLEAMVSRMRYIASQIETKIRFVALSYSLTSAEDFGKWIGASSHGLFNFSPDVRPVPVEMHVKGLDFGNFEARMHGMKKPAYSSIVQHSNGKPTIVFVPTMKHVGLTALAFLEYASMEDGEKPVFVLRSLKELEPFVDRIQDEMLRTTLLVGVGYVHEGLSNSDQEVVMQLFEDGWIQVLVMRSSMCWGVPLLAHLVVVMGTQYYCGSEAAHTDFPLTDLLQMIGHACRPLLDNSGKCVILCPPPREEYYQKFLCEALSVESSLQDHLHDHLNAEISAGVVQNKQDAVDSLTWTFMYQRLLKNPEYYNLKGLSRMHTSSYLTELVDDTTSDLEYIGWVSTEDDYVLSPAGLSKIASVYYVSYFTIRTFISCSTLHTTMEHLLRNLTYPAEEYEKLAIRPDEDKELKTMLSKLRFPIPNTTCRNPKVKAKVLLQAHLSRQSISRVLALDQRQVLVSTGRLLPVLVHVMAEKGFVDETLRAIDLIKMVRHQMWHDDPKLLQVPHFTKALALKCLEHPTKSIGKVSDLLNMEDNERRELLQLADSQLRDIVEFCKSYMEIQVSVEMKARDNITIFEVQFEGVTAKGGWWLVAENDYHGLLAHKRLLYLPKDLKVEMEVNIPSKKLLEVRLHIKSESYFDRDFCFNFPDESGSENDTN